MITIAPVPRHPPLVRITHWTAAASVAALVVSGTAILLAHPRLYWGETGVAGEPSLVDLPLPLVLTGQTGWGRSLHFLSAWTIVITGVVYVVAGMRRGRFRWPHYDALQRRTYTVVVFVLCGAGKDERSADHQAADAQAGVIDAVTCFRL